MTGRPAVGASMHLLYLPTATDPCKVARTAEYPAKNELGFLIFCPKHETSVDEAFADDEDYEPQQRRFAQYFLTVTILSAVAVACNLHWAPDLTRLHVVVLGTVAALCFAMAAILMVRTSRLTKMTLATQVIGQNHLERLCIAVYASIAVLMLAPITLLLQLDMEYAVVTIPLLPVGVDIFLLLRKGAVLGFSWGAAQYGPHDGDLRCLFRLAAGLTIPAYAGLLVLLLSKLVRRTAQQQEGINAVECLLLYAVVAGLVLMLLTSSPPALYFRQTRAVVVNTFLGVLADVQLGLVGLAGLAAAGEAAGGFVVLAFATVIVAACAIFAREHEDEPDHRGEHDIKHHLSSGSPPGVVLLVVNSLAFMVLMTSHSSRFAREQHYALSWRKKACVTMAASLLIGSLSQMALQRRAARTDSMLSAVAMFRKVYNVLLVTAVAFVGTNFVVDSDRCRVLHVIQT